MAITDEMVERAKQAVERIEVHSADHTRGLHTCLVAELLTANVVEDIVRAALEAALSEKDRPDDRR